MLNSRLTLLLQALFLNETGFIGHIFPSECLVCHKEGAWLCPNCEADTIAIKTATCPFCDKLSLLGKTCLRCRKNTELFGCRSIWYYEGAIPFVIQHFKYKGITRSQDYFAPKLLTLYHALPISASAQVIITAVPSDVSRNITYGYNQSAILAQSVSHSTNKPYTPLLSRKNKHISQTKLTRKERIEQAKEQFSLLSGATIPHGTTVILVDDVITTGSTLTNCAGLLKQAGAKAVWGLTLAKD